MTEEMLSNIYDILLIIILAWGFGDIDKQYDDTRKN